MRDVHNTIKALEISLHQSDVRNDVNKVKALLHPRFIEIGYSGKTYNLESTLEALANEKPSTSEVYSKHYEFIDLASNIIQVLYVSADSGDGELSRHAKRSSIWINISGSWVMQFHQGTPISATVYADF